MTDDDKERIEREVRAAVEAMILRPEVLDDELRAWVPEQLRRTIAARVGCAADDVELVNPRWDEAGRVFQADGVRVPVKRVHMTFDIGKN